MDGGTSLDTKSVVGVCTSGTEATAQGCKTMVARYGGTVMTAWDNSGYPRVLSRSADGTFAPGPGTLVKNSTRFPASNPLGVGFGSCAFYPERRADGLEQLNCSAVSDKARHCLLFHPAAVEIKDGDGTCPVSSDPKWVISQGRPTAAVSGGTVETPFADRSSLQFRKTDGTVQVIFTGSFDADGSVMWLASFPAF